MNETDPRRERLLEETAHPKVEADDSDLEDNPDEDEEVVIKKCSVGWLMVLCMGIGTLFPWNAVLQVRCGGPLLPCEVIVVEILRDSGLFFIVAGWRLLRGFISHAPRDSVHA